LVSVLHEEDDDHVLVIDGEREYILPKDQLQLLGRVPYMLRHAVAQYLIEKKKFVLIAHDPRPHLFNQKIDEETQRRLEESRKTQGPVKKQKFEEAIEECKKMFQHIITYAKYGSPDLTHKRYKDKEPDFLSWCEKQTLTEGDKAWALREFKKFWPMIAFPYKNDLNAEWVLNFAGAQRSMYRIHFNERYEKRVTLPVAKVIQNWKGMEVGEEVVVLQSAGGAKVKTDKGVICNVNPNDWKSHFKVREIKVTEFYRAHILHSKRLPDYEIKSSS